VVINLFNFLRHHKSSPFHTVIRIHLVFISLSYHILVILPSHFSSWSKCWCYCQCFTKMSHPQATVDNVSQWMSYNLVSLIQSKMEFLLIVLHAQLPKTSDSSLLKPSNAIITPTSSAGNLGVISSHQFHSKLKTFLFDQSFSPSSVCTNSCLFFGVLT